MGIIHGFHTGIDNAPTLSMECRNLLSARRDPATVTQLLRREIDSGYVIVPFESSPFPTHRVSPIGLAEGKYSKKKRLITDHSSPHNSATPSLNSLINKAEYSLSYVRIDDAIAIIKSVGAGTLMCKTDIQDAFKQIPLHPSVWHLHGIQWEEQFYYYTRLVFGSRSSPHIFDRLSRALCWIAADTYHIKHILHLLDDFLTIGCASADGNAAMTTLLLMFQRLQIPLSASKTVGPTTCLEFLGIILDSQQMEVRLPQGKIDRIVANMETIEDKRTVTKRHLLQILGHLNFAMQVIRPGRAFISYLLCLAHSVTELHYYVTITKDCRLEFEMWRNFLRYWNEKSFFLEEAIMAHDFQLFTDAAASIGHGAYFQGLWFAEKWPRDFLRVANEDMSIALMELYPIY